MLTLFLRHLRYDAVSKPAWLNVSSSGLVTGTPGNEDVGDHDVTVRVTDSAGASDEKTFTLTVNNVNDAPVFDFTPPTGLEQDAAFTLTLSAHDPDSVHETVNLTYSAIVLPSWLTLTSDGVLQGTPSNEHVGEHEVIVRVADQQLGDSI